MEEKSIEFLSLKMNFRWQKILKPNYVTRIAIALPLFFMQTSIAKLENLQKEEEIDEWEKEKQKCSFCKFFLGSPCRVQFRDWSKCVDKAKAADENFVEICQNYSDALFACTDQNKSYFDTPSEEPDELEVVDEKQKEH